MKQKIKDIEIKGYSFTGYIETHLLEDYRLEMLGIDKNVMPELKVSGEFSVFCNDDECYIDNMEWIAFDLDHRYIDLNDNEYDAEQLCDDLVDQGDQGQWCQDRYERMADAAYDRMNDR